MIVGDIIRVTVKGLLLAQEIRNVYFYIVDEIESGVTILDFLEDLASQVIDLSLDLSVADMAYSSIVGENLTDEIGFDEFPYVKTGADPTGGTAMPSFNAVGFRMNVGTRITRPGAKRIAGTGEGRVTDNTYVPLGTAAQNFADAIAEPALVVTPGLLTATLLPVIIGRTILGALDLSKVNPVTSGQFSTLMTSQNSRKARG